METFIKIIIGLVIVCLVVINPLVAYGTKSQVEFTVKEKERVCTGGQSGECKYLIYTDSEVFENTDSLWYFKFNSSDVYGELDAGTTYKSEVYGFRVPFFSWYRNVIDATPI